jgi:EAL domain-containing protein (putative c-di-GMP-specific phosphodiesterase class I)/GGDEF domain-containing protein
MGYNVVKEIRYGSILTKLMESDVMPFSSLNVNLIEKYIVDHIDEAIEKHYIKVFYQPVIRTITGYLCGLEGLSRWEDPVNGFLTSMDFVPVLEKYDLISKLDIFVINEICKTINERVTNNEPIVPISFNLSRLDFLECDIFNEVEKALRKYDVPRDMICVEITESVFVQNKEIITSAIDKFHDAGYKVWMDDFGSGYSSLNVLKDYSFDELKIDMAFLTNFNLKSKKIITSTIQMAKNIGVQTLAEGVENIDQYNFLRDIGCEKVQGYFFGKPMPIQDAINCCLLKDIKIETRLWKDYFDAVGVVDFNTDQAFALIEYDTKEIHFKFVNQKFKDIIKETHDYGVQDLEIEVNGDNQFSNMIRKFNKNVITSKNSRSLSYVSGYNNIRIETKVIAQNGTKYMLYTTITNITSDEAKDQSELIAKVNKNLFYLYDSVEYFSLSGKYDAGVKVDVLTSKETVTNNIAEQYEDFANKHLLEEDIDLFKKFFDLNTLAKRISASKKGHITAYFRVKDDSGTFHWTEHTLIAVPMTNNNDFIHCVRKINVSDNVLEALKIKLKTDYFEAAFINKDLITQEALLFENIVKYSKTKLFWKDKNRRFLGASPDFLNYYGFKLEDILGKNDEDMNWHINNDPYRNVEWQVINKGKSEFHVPGKCIINGRVHNIVASKFPFYVGDNIEGLIGYFLDIEELGDRTNQQFAAFKDELTGTTNSMGFFSTLAVLNEEYRTKGEKFAAIKIRVPEIRRIIQTYGIEIGQDTIVLIANKLFKTVGVTGEICRLSESMFIILYRYTNIDALNKLIDEITLSLEDLHKSGNKDVTIHPQIKVLEVKDTTAIDDFISKILLL